MTSDKEAINIKPNPKAIRLFFFWVGIIATVAYRIIIVLNFYSPLWVSAAWYIGTIGFIIHFAHRFDVDRKRANLVKEYNLVEAVNKVTNIDEQKKIVLSYLIETTLTSKSRWNSALIFILSVIALLIGIFLDISR